MNTKAGWLAAGRCENCGAARGEAGPRGTGATERLCAGCAEKRRTEARARYAAKKARGAAPPQRSPEQKARHAASVLKQYRERRAAGRCGACGRERDAESVERGWADCAACHRVHLSREAARRARLRQGTWRGAGRGGRPLPTGRAAGTRLQGAVRLHFKLDVESREALRALLRRDAERQAERQQRFGVPVELEYRASRIVRECIAGFSSGQRQCLPRERRTLCCGLAVGVWVDAGLRAVVERVAARWFGGDKSEALRCMLVYSRPLVMASSPRRGY